MDESNMDRIQHKGPGFSTNSSVEYIASRLTDKKNVYL